MKISILTIFLVIFPLTGVLAIDRLVFAKNKVNAVIRLLLVFIVIGVIFWIIDIVKLIIGSYDREKIV